MKAILSQLTYQRSLLGLLGSGILAAMAQAGCAPAEEIAPLDTRSAALDQADCAEYGGTWTQGACRLPGGTTTVDVPIPPDDEPIEPPFHDPPSDDDTPPCDTCGGGDPDPGPGPDPVVVCSLYDKDIVASETYRNDDPVRAYQDAQNAAKQAAVQACDADVGPVCTRASAAAPVVLDTPTLGECRFVPDSVMGDWSCTARAKTYCSHFLW